MTREEAKRMIEEICYQSEKIGKEEFKLEIFNRKVARQGCNYDVLKQVKEINRKLPFKKKNLKKYTDHLIWCLTNTPENLENGEALPLVFSNSDPLFPEVL